MKQMKQIKIEDMTFTHENEVEVEKLIKEGYIQVNTIRERSGLIMIFRKEA
jgi:hypothetical protein